MLDFRSYGPSEAVDVHDFVQVVMPSRGVLDIEVDGRAGRVDAQQAALIRAGTAHSCGATGRNSFIVLDVTAPTIDMPDLRRLADRVFFSVTPGLSALTTWLRGAHAPETRPTIEGRVASAWSSLALQTLAAHPANGATSPRLRPDDRAERVLRIIRRRFAEPLTVDELAAEVGLSGRRVATLFRAAYGTTLHARLAEVRLQHAVSLLESTTLPIAEVAARSGYYDQSALTRHMKAALGTTPAAIRRG